MIMRKIFSDTNNDTDCEIHRHRSARSYLPSNQKKKQIKQKKKILPVVVLSHPCLCSGYKEGQSGRCSKEIPRKYDDGTHPCSANEEQERLLLVSWLLFFLFIIIPVKI